MTDAQNAHSESALQERLLNAVAGIDQFSRNWSWRSHSPKQRAESAIAGALTLLSFLITAQ